jgi:hypothetical protein
MTFVPIRTPASREFLIASLMLSLATVSGAIWYARHEIAVAGGLGFPLDDAWIHLQFARNLAEDGQLAFNEGEPSSGSTSPLWTMLLAVPLLAGFDAVISAKVLGTLLTAAAAILCWMLTKLLTSSSAAAYVAALATAISPRLTWGSVSGMEVPLYVALYLAAVLVFVRDPDRGAPWWGALAALAGTARPETFLLFAVLAVHRVLITDGVPPNAAWRAIRRAGMPFALIVTVYAAVNMSGGGMPWPSTLAVKSEGGGLFGALSRADLAGIFRTALLSPLNALNTFVRFFFAQSALLTMFMVPGALALLRLLGAAHRRGSIVVVLAMLPALTLGAVAPALSVPQQEGRYVAHGLVFTFIVCASGVAALASVSRKAWPVWAIAALAVARLASQNVLSADHHARMVHNISTVHLHLGQWLKSNTPPDAVVAVNDIGGIAWVSGRRVLDLEGIVTPEIIPYRGRGAHLEFLEQRQPDYLVIFPEWYPRLVARADLFEEVYRVSVPRVSAAHDSMVVYRTPWTGR